MNEFRESLPERIAKTIQQDHIDSGVLKAGDRLPTVLELAKLHGVSSATITHALGLLDQAGLIDRRKGSGCYVNEPVSLNRAMDVGHIAFIAPNYSAEIFVRMSHGVETACRRAGMNMMVAGTGHFYEEEREEVRRMIRGGARAIVLSPVSRGEALLRDDYLKREFLDFPIVLIGAAMEEQRRPSVVFDNYRVGVEFTNYLVNKGHTRIAFLDDTPPGEIMTHLATRERHRGLEDTLGANGLKHSEDDHWHIRIGPNADLDAQAARLAEAWLDQPPEDRATAAFAYYDAMAVALIRALTDRGVSVPEDIEVIGFDNMPIGQSFIPAFHTTQSDFEHAGKMAADLAIQLANNPNPGYTPRYFLPVQILFRGVQQPRPVSHSGKGKTRRSMS